MYEVLRTEAFERWQRKLRDDIALSKISTRIYRLAHGYAGDVKPIREGVFELRIHFGPGYRVYFMREGNTIIILLCGGTKSSQDRDIRRALLIAHEIRSERG